MTVTGAQGEIDICHCTMCQRWGGKMYAGNESDGFALNGENHISTYDSSDWAERAFCSRYGSNLWYKFKPPGARTFLAGLFDWSGGLPIKHQIFIDEKPDWFDIAQDSPKKTGAHIIAEVQSAGFTFE